MSTTFQNQLEEMLKRHQSVESNPERKSLIQQSLDRKEAITMKGGALATWTRPESTGRSPKDTYIVKHEATAATIDWTSPNNVPLDPQTFEMVFEDALETLNKGKVYVTDRVIGADSKYALPVKTVVNKSLSQVFVDNMFRDMPEDIEKSIFAERGFTLLALPDNKLNPERYKGRLREMPDGTTSNMCVAMDFDRRVGIVFGSAYMGSIKKLMFTVMNYYLPLEGILPLHCSANEGTDGSSALLLGLSGTGKTTLSADPKRALLGDDEHGWSEDGIANFENGCYAKMIDIKEENEPEIWKAVMHENDPLNHGSIVENAMVYPDGTVDYFDDRYTPNSRASYPLKYLSNIKPASTSGHPKTILFLTADAYGVLPPVSQLNADQAMLWFLMGYTSKLAGTETGVTEPQATFSRFFGQPFMPGKPSVYAEQLGEKMKKYNTKVYLINTGWSGGKYGVGARIKLKYTRAMVDAALNGELEKAEYVKNDIFHVNVPKSVSNVPDEMLIPKNTWADKADYDATAAKLAQKFSEHFDKAYGSHGLSDGIIKSCPGK